MAAVLLVTGIAAQRVGRVRSAAEEVLIPGVVFGLLLLMPLGILFQKTGMQNHYVLPGVLAVAFFLILAFKFIQGCGSRALRFAAIVLVGIQAAFGSAAAYDASLDFWERSEKVRKVVESVRDQTKPNGRILSVLDPSRQIEWARAVKTYLERVGDRKNLFMAPILRPKLSALEKYLTYDHPLNVFKVYAGRVIDPTAASSAIADLVVCYPYNEIWFLMQSRRWFKPSDYERTVIGNFVTYRRKGTAG
jgi:hypothetical protein